MSFGFDADRLLVWISERQPLDDPMQSGSLCRRHADAMVVPQGWTLDDRREPGPRLFSSTATPSTDAPSPRATRTRRRTGKEPDVTQQLALDEQVRTVADVAGPMSDSDRTAPIPWSPVFDEADDLDGILSADTPLLARAFRGADRRR